MRLKRRELTVNGRFAAISKQKALDVARIDRRACGMKENPGKILTGRSFL